MRTSFTSIARDVSMTAEVHLHTDSGEECDECEPFWFIYAEGDKEADSSPEPLVLDVALFPPGTLVTVEEPVCPNCDEARDVTYNSLGQRSGWADACECGFSWKEWELNEHG